MILKCIVFAFTVVGILADSFEKIPSEHEIFTEVFQTICKQNGAEDIVEPVVNSFLASMDCLNNTVGFDTVTSNEASDEIFKMCCSKTPELKKCMYKAIDSMSPCMNQTNLNVTGNKDGIDRLVDFICDNDAEKLSMFVLNEGLLCFANKWNAISPCLSKVDEPVSSDKDLTVAEKCAKFDEVATCIIDVVKECPNPNLYPSSFYESLASSYRKGTPCDSALPSN